MKYLVSIYHPAHVHFYRHIVDELEAGGARVRVCVRDKDVSLDLLESFDIPYRVLARSGDSLSGVLAGQLRYEKAFLDEARHFDPDVITSIGGVEVSHVSPFVRARTVVFNDSEGTPSHRIMVTPFLDAIHTPRRHREDFGSPHRRYDGYHELAYLHPDRFRADPDRLSEFGIDPENRYFVLRFVGWNAHHDVGQEGLSPDAKRELVTQLSEVGDVYVTNEGGLPLDLADYETPVQPHLIHDLLAHADLYVGDSQTMATEAAVLGTPAIRSNSFAVNEEMSNFVELEEYGLLRSIPDERAALDLAFELAEDRQATERWQRRRQRLLDDKIDVTKYAVETLREEGRKARQGGSADGRTTFSRVRTALIGGGPG